MAQRILDQRAGPHCKVSSDASLDAALLIHMPALADAFVRKWGLDHLTHCRQPSRCKCWMLDGHMKTKRIVCANKYARIFQLGSLGTAVLGCTHKPMNGSRFCRECREAAACSAAGLKGSMGQVSEDISIPEVCTECEIDDDQLERHEVEATEQDVYMVEKLLD